MTAKIIVVINVVVKNFSHFGLLGAPGSIPQFFHENLFFD